MLIEPDVFGDHRGFFLETYNQSRYDTAGISTNFIQDNLSFSSKGILRGLHIQNPYSQAKLVQVLHGAVFDVAVDIRHGSPTFGQWTGVELNGENKHQLFIPSGFAHGFCTLSDDTYFSYKCSDDYHPECEFSVLWSDPDIGIQWPVEDFKLSDKDRAAPRLSEIPPDNLPAYV